MHYYVHPLGWKKKGSATDFDDKVWYMTMWKALYIEELIKRHGAIMDQYDPKKKVGMIIDGHISTTAPIFISNTKIVNFPRIRMSIFCS